MNYPEASFGVSENRLSPLPPLNKWRGEALHRSESKVKASFEELNPLRLIFINPPYCIKKHQPCTINYGGPKRLLLRHQAYSSIISDNDKYNPFLIEKVNKNNIFLFNFKNNMIRIFLSKSFYIIPLKNYFYELLFSCMIR
jgi:hypothetical protein